MEPQLDENGEDQDCLSYDECKKYYTPDPEIGMCEGCDHCQRDDADAILDRIREVS